MEIETLPIETLGEATLSCGKTKTKQTKQAYPAVSCNISRILNKILIHTVGTRKVT